MISLILAIFSNSAESIVVRLSEDNLHNRYAITMINYLVAVVMCLFFIDWGKGFGIGGEYNLLLYLGIFNGVLFIAWLWLFQVSVRKNGAPLSATFTKLGVLLPTVGSIVVFAEQPGVVQYVGIAFALAAIVLFNLKPAEGCGVAAEQDDMKGGGFSLLLIVILLIGGMADFNSKIFESLGAAELDGLFLFYTFLVAFIISVGLFLRNNRAVNKNDVKYGVLLGVFNQLTTMLLLWAVMSLPASVVYPVYSVAVILTVSLVNGIIFKEHFSRWQWLAMGLVCVALVCLNI